MATIADDVTVPTVPYSIDRSRLPLPITQLLDEAVRARTRVDAWHARAKAYPEQVSGDVTSSALQVVFAVPLAFFWLIAVVVALVLVSKLGVVAAFLLGVVWVAVWTGVFVVTKLLYTVRPPRHDLFASDVRTATGDVWRRHWRTVAYPFVVLPESVSRLLAAYLAPNEATPDTEDARALSITGDGRVQLALAVVDDTDVLNRLAVMLRREEGVLRINQGVRSTVDVPRLTALVAGMRETTLGQVEFLDLMLPEAPLGEFRGDLTGMLGANAERCEEARGFLAKDTALCDAAIEIARLRVGLGSRST